MSFILIWSETKSYKHSLIIYWTALVCMSGKREEHLRDAPSHVCMSVRHSLLPVFDICLHIHSSVWSLHVEVCDIFVSTRCPLICVYEWYTFACTCVKHSPVQVFDITGSFRTDTLILFTGTSLHWVSVVVFLFVYQLHFQF